MFYRAAAVILLTLTTIGCQTVDQKYLYSHRPDRNEVYRQLISEAANAEATINDVKRTKQRMYDLRLIAHASAIKPDTRKYRLYADLREARAIQLTAAHDAIAAEFARSPYTAPRRFRDLFNEVTDAGHPTYELGLRYRDQRWADDRRRQREQAEEEQRKLGKLIETAISIPAEYRESLIRQGKCPNCWGRGFGSYTQKITCGVCSGNGCPRCMQTGMQDGKTTTTSCSHCGGSGRLHGG